MNVKQAMPRPSDHDEAVRAAVMDAPRDSLLEFAIKEKK